MDIEQRMREALHDGASRLALPEAGPLAARERARRHTRHRQAGLAGVTAVAVGLGGVAGLRLLPDDRLQLGPGGAAADGGAGAVAQDPLARLDWQSAEGVVTAAREILTSADGVSYALSTAPGSARADHPDDAVPQALYRSDDGLSWESAALGERPWIADLGERDGLLYAVSTAPAPGASQPGGVGVSADGGVTWDRVSLPTTAEPPAATVPVGGPHVSAAIAVGETRVLARLRTQYTVDTDGLFPDVDRGDGSATFTAVRDEGVALVALCQPADGLAVGSMPVAVDLTAERQAAARAIDGLAACVEDDGDDQEVLELMPWADLGLTGPGDLVVDELFVSDDGETWEPVAGGGLGGDDLVDLTAGPDGFLAVTFPAFGDGRPQLLRSADGTAWEVVAQDVPTTLLGFSGGSIIGFGHTGDEPVATASADGGTTWDTTDLAALLDPDAVPGEHTVIAHDTGPLGAAVILGRYGPAGGPTDLTLLTSADGRAWSTTPLADVVGDADLDYVSWLAVGADRIAFTAVGPLPDGERIAPSRTFVGTPQR